MKKFFILFLILGLTLAAAVPAAMAQDAPPARHARITLVPERAVIAPGETVTVAIVQELDAGWHTYWRNPGDSGEAMRIDWTLPSGYAAGAVQWPVPQKIMTGPLASYGYHDRATMLADLTTPADAPAGPVTIGAEITVLVCADICIPETTTHTLVLNDGAAAANAALVAAAREALPRALTGTAAFREADDQLIITLDPALYAALPDGGTLMPHDWGLIDNTAQTVIGDGAIRHKRGDRPVRAVRETRFLVARDGAGIEFIAEAVAGDAPATAGGPAPSLPAAKTSMETDISLLAALALAFAGGLILNLMPCVFPVLFMKALSLCRLSDKEEGEARLQALLYTAGILASFAAVAGILLALRAGGAQIGWGFQLQNPAVIGVLAALFFAIGLNLSGVFDISGRFAGIGQGMFTRGGRYGQAFLMGTLATIVATPCTAPFMGVAMGYAIVQPPAIALSVFLALGLGLAFPYVLLSYVPPLRHVLPRPGAWMEVFRRILAIPMFLTVAWLAWVFNSQLSLVHTGGLLAGFAALGVSLYVAARSSRPPVAVAVLAAGLIAAVAVPLAAVRLVPVPAPVVASAENHTPYTAAALQESLSATARPVFVNMTADWCITCKVNEKIALSAAATAALFRDRGVIYYVGDWTRQDPEITKYLASYGRTGVPLYVFYGAPDRGTGKRPEPVVLPQLLTPSIITETVQGGTE